MFSAWLVAASIEETRRESQILAFTFTGRFHRNVPLYSGTAGNRAVANPTTNKQTPFL
jgi:hypothetical protein